MGLFWLFLFSRIIFATIGIYFCRKWVGLPRGLKHIPSLLQFGVPYGVICTIGAFMPALDRAFIGRFLTMDSLGLYAAGYKVALLINLPVQAFQTAWGPFCFSLFKEDNAAETYQHVFIYFTAIVCFAILIISCLAEPLLIILASARYSAAASIVFPLILGVGIQAIGWIPSIGIDLSKKAHLNLYSYIPSLIMTGIAIVLLIKPFGIVGVAYGVCLGLLLRTIFQVVLAGKSYHLRFSMKKPLLIIVVMSVMGFLSTLIKFQSILFSFVNCAISISIFSFLIWCFVFTSKEKSYLLQVFRRIILKSTVSPSL